VITDEGHFMGDEDDALVRISYSCEAPAAPQLAGSCVAAGLAVGRVAHLSVVLESLRRRTVIGSV
jgi:hypothetical protein